MYVRVPDVRLRAGGWLWVLANERIRIACFFWARNPKWAVRNQGDTTIIIIIIIIIVAVGCVWMRTFSRLLGLYVVVRHWTSSMLTSRSQVHDQTNTAQHQPNQLNLTDIIINYPNPITWAARNQNVHLCVCVDWRLIGWMERFMNVETIHCLIHWTSKT